MWLLFDFAEIRFGVSFAFPIFGDGQTHVRRSGHEASQICGFQLKVEMRTRLCGDDTRASES